MNRYDLILNNVNPYYRVKYAEKMPWYGRLYNRAALGGALAAGFNGAPEGEEIIGPGPDYPINMADPTWKSRGRQAAAIGAIGTGALGGGYLGYKGTGWLNKKLGLTADRGGWRKWTGRGVRALGTLAGANTGANLGSALAGLMAGGSENQRQELYDAVKQFPDTYNMSDAEKAEWGRGLVNKFYGQVQPW